MLYQHIAALAGKAAPVRVAVLGAGAFGAGIIGHSRYVPAVRVSAVADPDIEAARRAYRQAGVADEWVVVCESEGEVAAALEAGKRVVTPAAEPLFAQRLDVIAEATGIPEAGARHARAAIQQGKHVAMVNKETDVTVGPMLKHMADRAGVVYSAVEGDQHGMLIGLVAWARLIGLEVLCGGKALDDELILTGRELVRYSRRMPLEEQTTRQFMPMQDAFTAETLMTRAEFLGEIGGAKPWDIVELTIAANATGLRPDVPQLHCPACWTGEIPGVLCPRDLGGMLSNGGIVDAAQVIRRPHEASMGGGVFIVVRTPAGAKGKPISPGRMTCNWSGETALIVRPHHLLGIEAIGTIFSIAMARVPTAALEYRPNYDIVYRTTKRLRAGDVVGHDHSAELTAEMVPAARLGGHTPLPAEMARGNRLARDVEQGAVIAGAHVERPRDSVLWELREEQEKLFMPG